jgi:N-dimethylarginine dimethylaminohydrolase
MIAVNVKDEFAPLKVALVHDALNAIDLTMEAFRKKVEADILREHPETGPVFKQRVIEQQAHFLRLLEFHGVQLLNPDTRLDATCQVFTRDPCFAVGGTLFLGSLRDRYRHTEVGGLVRIGQEASAIAGLWGDGAIIEGGDVFVLDEGRTVLVGMNRHTNEAGLRHLAAHLKGQGSEVVAVPHKALHLDCCFAPLPNREALVAADKLTDVARKHLERHFRLLELDRVEAALHLAANLLWLDEQRVISGVAARKTNELLRSRGYEVYELDFSQLVCKWGSFRCVTCPLVRGQAQPATAA